MHNWYVGNWKKKKKKKKRFQQEPRKTKCWVQLDPLMRLSLFRNRIYAIKGIYGIIIEKATFHQYHVMDSLIFWIKCQLYKIISGKILNFGPFCTKIVIFVFIRNGISIKVTHLYLKFGPLLIPGITMFSTKFIHKIGSRTKRLASQV